MNPVHAQGEDHPEGSGDEGHTRCGLAIVRDRHGRLRHEGRTVLVGYRDEHVTCERCRVPD